MKGIFVGISTLDVIHEVPSFPPENQKLYATRTTVAAGGNASNAAVAFAHGYSSDTCDIPQMNQPSETKLVTRIASDAVGELVYFDLERCGIEVVNVGEGTFPDIASIIVNRENASRTIVSGHAPECKADDFAGVIGDLDELFECVDIVMSDGYDLDAAASLLADARKRNIPVMSDIERQRPNTDQLISLCDIVISSANYFDGNFEAAASHAKELGCNYFAMTFGEEGTRYSANGEVGHVSAVRVDAVDTLAAGDFFHGAFAKAIAGKELTHESFVNALETAALIASVSVQSFGSREWLKTA